jgi:hypothetical protein
VISLSFNNSPPITLSISIIICGGIATTVQSCPRNTDDLLKDEVKHRKSLLRDIKLNEVTLILRTSCRIPNARSQGSTEETVESVQLWKEVLNLGRSGRDTWSIHELHITDLEHIIGVNPSLWGHG